THVPISEEEIRGAVSYLRSEKRWVAETSVGVVLTSEGRRCVANEEASHAQRVQTILDRFPRAIDREKLLAWFKVTAAKFFERYGAHTANALFRDGHATAAAP